MYLYICSVQFTLGILVKRRRRMIEEPSIVCSNCCSPANNTVKTFTEAQLIESVHLAFILKTFKHQERITKITVTFTNYYLMQLGNNNRYALVCMYTHIYTYISLYIYTYVCVCVCVYFTWPLIRQPFLITSARTTWL